MCRSPKEIKKSIKVKILNVNFKNNCEDNLRIFNPIACALDKIQSNKCKIADVVIIWKELRLQMANILNEKKLKMVDKRYTMAMNPCHFALVLLLPMYSHNSKYDLLTENEKKLGMEYIFENFSLAFSDLMKKYEALEFPFSPAIISASSNLTSFQWWKSFQSIYPDKIGKLDYLNLLKLTTAVASSAGVERIFSAFGLVHTKLRNRLGVQKAAKLTF